MCRIITYIVLMCLIITYIVLMCRIITYNVSMCRINQQKQKHIIVSVIVQTMLRYVIKFLKQ
jgi:hypothetical protein